MTDDFDFSSLEVNKVRRRSKKTVAKARSRRTWIAIAVPFALAIGILVLSWLFSGQNPQKPLERDAAERLVAAANRSGSDYILVPHCRGLTTDAASILSQFDGDLDLWRVSTISRTAAERLAAHTGQLTLGIRSLDLAVASALSAFKGKELWLPGVRDLTTECATALLAGSGTAEFWLPNLERIESGAKAHEASSDRLTALGRNGRDPIVYGQAVATSQQGGQSSVSLREQLIDTLARDVAEAVASKKAEIRRLEQSVDLLTGRGGGGLASPVNAASMYFELRQLLVAESTHITDETSLKQVLETTARSWAAGQLSSP